MYRLVDRFRGTAVAEMEEYFGEAIGGASATWVRHRDGRPGARNGDAEEGKVDPD